MSVNITTNNNTVSVTNTNQSIAVTDNSQNTTTIISQPVTSTIQVNALGPQGAQGPRGAQGETGVFTGSGSFATTGSNVFIGNQIITGSIIFNEGARISPTYYGNNYIGYIDIVAGTSDGFVELVSYNSQSYFWVDDYGVYMTTSASYNWSFNNNGTTTMPGSVLVTGAITASYVSGAIAAPGTNRQIPFNNSGTLDADLRFAISNSGSLTLKGFSYQTGETSTWINANDDEWYGQTYYGTDRGRQIIIQGGIGIGNPNPTGSSEGYGILIGGSVYGGNNSYFNTVVGYGSYIGDNTPRNVIFGRNISYGGESVLLGNYVISSGSGNIAISNNTNYNASQITGSGNIILGRMLSNINANNLVLLGNSSHNVSIGGYTNPTYKLQITGSGVSGSFNADNILYVSGSRIGIGTTSPSSMLDVKNTTNNNLFKLTRTSTSSYPYVVAIFDHSTTLGNQGGVILSFQNNGTPEAAIEFNSSIINANELRLGNYTANGYISFLTAGELAANERMRITAVGNVGIGTTTPSTSLHVSGSVLVTGDITGSNALFTGTITAQKLVVQTISSSVIYSSGSNKFGNDITNTQVFTGSLYQTGSIASFMGNVGIGTTAPTSILDVVRYTTAVDNSYQFRILNSGNGQYPYAVLLLEHQNRTGVGNQGGSTIVFKDGQANVIRGGINFDYFSSTSHSGSGGNLTVSNDGFGNIYFSNNAINTMRLYPDNGVAIGGISTAGLTSSARLLIKGATTSALSSSLLVQNSTGQAYFKVDDAGTVSLGKIGDGEALIWGGNFRTFLQVNSNKLELRDYTNNALGAFSSTGLVLTNASDPFALNRLDVVGKAFIGPAASLASASLHVRGFTSSSLSSSLLVQSLDNVYSFNIKDNGDLLTTNNFVNISSYDTTINGNNGVKINGTAFGTGYIWRNVTNGFLNLSNDAVGATNITLYGSEHATLADTIRFNQSGSTLMTMSGSRVGIGTTTPIANLQIGDGSNGAINLYIGGGAGSDQTIGFNINGNQVYHNIVSNGSTGEFRFTAGANGSGHYLTFRTGGNTERMRITAVGNVGIGTATPSASLHISGASSANLLRVGTPATSNILLVSGAFDSSTQINAWSERFRLFTISRIGDTTSPVISLGAGSGPTATAAIVSANNDYLIFGYSVGSNFTEVMRTDTSNQFGVGTGGTISSRFQVKGSGTTSATTAFLVQNSNASASLTVLDGVSTSGFLVTAGNLTDTTAYRDNLWRPSTLASARDITIGSDGTLGGYSSRLNFINYYNNGGQGSTSNLAGYIRTSIGQYTATGGGGGSQPSGRGTLLLGVYDTDYSSVVLNSFDVVSVGKYTTTISGSLTVFGTNASTSLTVLDNGYVAIGTGSAGDSLHVYGNVNIHVPNQATRLKTDSSGAYLELNPSTNQWGQLTIATGTGGGTDSQGPMIFNIQGNEAVRIVKSGKVGIGTTAPDYKLTVAGSESTLLNVSSSGGTAKLQIKATYNNILQLGSDADNTQVWYDASYATSYIDNNYGAARGAGNQYGDIQFRSRLGSGTALTSSLTIRGYNGSVGIGTTVPAARLDVASGSAIFRNDLNNSTYAQFVGVHDDGRQRLADSSGYNIIGWKPGSFGSVGCNTGYFNVGSLPGMMGWRVGDTLPIIAGAFIGTDSTTGGTHKSLKIVTGETGGTSGYIDFETVSVAGNVVTGSRPSIRISADKFIIGSDTNSSGIPSRATLTITGSIISITGSLTVTGSLSMSLDTGTPVSIVAPAGYYKGTLNGSLVYIPYYT